MKLLALDTSTEACSVALALDGELVERFELEPRHGERLLQMVEQLLADAALRLAQLDAIAFGRGPGSFTSLRIGAGVVQGLAFGADLPVVPVSSLAALAQGVDATKILAAFDARMGQVYWGAFLRSDSGLVAPAGAEAVLDPSLVPVPPGTGWTGAGGGWDRYHAALTARVGGAIKRWRVGMHPHACDLARLAVADYATGHRVTAEEAIPVYLRDDVARPKSA